jgi:hypothetical protein
VSAAERGAFTLSAAPLQARQDRIVADARYEGIVRSSQDHLGGGGGGRRRIWSGRGEKAVSIGVVIEDIADDLAGIVDASGPGAGGAERIVERRVGAVVMNKAVDRAVVVDKLADDLARVVDARDNGPLIGGMAGERIVERRVDAVQKEKAVIDVVAVDVSTYDPPVVGDAGRIAVRAQRVVNIGPGARAVLEAMEDPEKVSVIADDLPRAVDPSRLGDHGSHGVGIVQGVAAAALQEPVRAVAVYKVANDLSRGVDAGCDCEPVGQGIINGGVDTAAIDEPVHAGVSVIVISDDQAQAVDAQRGGAGAPELDSVGATVLRTVVTYRRATLIRAAV